ncbi:membrane protein DedA with SNARE-associated domain [Agromyces terreus]|uniref:Membrane protein DedA with SNARE-associated domain n=1 Tax=Agromyces terreus TaxID=424795 RepID=A0A9X2KFG6_9MICO|nr:DedA family protein [Agromyces terreus]MCP2371727.1 membrane protein DedA with SNARE-associated domain [Agromyces terreus]
MNEILDWILNTVQNVDPVARTLLAGLGIMLETSVLIGLVVPGDTIVLVASTAVDGALEYFSLVAAVICGALLGESIGFALGRWFGPHIQHSRLGRRLGEENWRKAQRYLDRRGGPAVFISRFLPVLHSLIPLTVGMSTMRYRRFIAWTLPACVIWTFAYVSVGSAAAEGYRELSRELHWAGYVFVAVIVVFLALVWLAKRLIFRSEAAHMSDAATEAGANGATDAAIRDVPSGAAADDEGPDAEASDPSNPTLSA